MQVNNYTLLFYSLMRLEMSVLGNLQMWSIVLLASCKDGISQYY